MRKALASIVVLVLCGGFSAAASAADVIRYLSCRADNETEQSVVAIDETRKAICDREFAAHWLAPSIYDATTIEWGDGAGSTKSITRGRKGSRYEHDSLFIVVHIGHCHKMPAPAEQPCKG
jgi:hypothetical protein